MQKFTFVHLTIEKLIKEEKAKLPPPQVCYLDFLTASLTVVFGCLSAYFLVTNLPVTAERYLDDLAIKSPPFLPMKGGVG